MKKLVLLSAATVAMLAASCGGNKSEDKVDDSAEFAASQPLVSGEYRAVSFQDTASSAVRTRFDGRILLALSPDNSGIYIYENGNRTRFKASVSLSAPFEKQDSIYVAADKDSHAIKLIKGTDIDTLTIYRAGKPVKVAFERKPMSEMTATEVWGRISAQIAK